MIVIVGGSGSGKSTLADAFVSRHEDYHRVITFTTRPIREGEKDGVDYHFVTNETFAEYARQKVFAEYGEYRGWYYGTAIEDCANSEKNIAVLTPKGARALRRAGIDCRVVYLYVDRRNRMMSMLRRGDNIEEAYRRSLTEIGQFDGMAEEADYVIDNTKRHMSIDDAVKCLEAIVKEIEEKSGQS